MTTREGRPPHQVSLASFAMRWPPGILGRCRLVRNIDATIEPAGGDDDPEVIVSAPHYDSAPERRPNIMARRGPRSSSSHGCCAISDRRAASASPSLFVNEEPPIHDPRPWAAWLCGALANERGAGGAMYSLETIGFYSSEREASTIRPFGSSIHARLGCLCRHAGGPSLIQRRCGRPGHTGFPASPAWRPGFIPGIACPTFGRRRHVFKPDGTDTALSLSPLPDERHAGQVDRRNLRASEESSAVIRDLGGSAISV